MWEEEGRTKRYTLYWTFLLEMLRFDKWASYKMSVPRFVSERLFERPSRASIEIAGIGHIYERLHHDQHQWSNNIKTQKIRAPCHTMAWSFASRFSSYDFRLTVGFPHCLQFTFEHIFAFSICYEMQKCFPYSRERTTRTKQNSAIAQEVSASQSTFTFISCLFSYRSHRTALRKRWHHASVRGRYCT